MVQKKIGKELVNFLEKKYEKNYLYEEPISWKDNFYSKQLNKGKKNGI